MLDPGGELGIAMIGGGGANGGVVDALFLGVIAGETSDNRDETEGDRELVGNDASDAAVAVEKWVDADETIVEMREKAADFVNVAGVDEFGLVAEGASEGVELVVNFGAAAGDMMEIFVAGVAEADVVAEWA